MRLLQFSLANRLFLVTGVALLPALLILAYNEISLRHSREAEIHATALRTGELAALELQRILDGSEGILRAIARASVVRSFSTEACNEYLGDLKAELPQLASITAIDRQGNLKCRSTPANVTTGYDKLPYFQQALAADGFVIGEYTIGRNSGVAVLPLAVPIKDAAGAVIGVVAAGLDLGWLGARLRDRDFSENRALTVADRNGVIIAREPFPERFVGTRIPDAFEHLVHGDHSGTLEVTSQDGTQRIIGYIPAKQMGLYVSAGLSRKDAFAPIDDATTRGALLALTGALLAFLTAWLLGRGLVRGPINRVMTTIEAWRAGDVAMRTGMRRGNGEIADIGAAIDQSMDELAAARTARRKVEEHRDLLVGELEHRVKNTFASILAVAQQTFVSSDSSKIDLRKFSDRLRSLAEAHRLLTSEQWQSADLAQTIAACLDPYRGSRDQFHVTGESVMLQPKAALSLSMATHELCTNAIKYGALSTPEGRVEVTWRLEDSQGNRQFHFLWRESGGPEVNAPTQKGFGSRMIERVLASELGGTVEMSYPKTGLVCSVTAPAARVVAAALS